MAPRKEKSEKASSDKGFVQAAAAKILKEMHERGEIEGRASGKQLVYHAVQDAKDAASPEELAAMNEEVETIREQISGSKTEHKTLMTALNALQSTLTTDDLQKAVGEAEFAREELQARIAPLRSGSVNAVSVEEKEKVEMARKTCQRDANVRKRIFRDFWDLLCDNLPESVNKDDVWERFDLGNDDA
ncbi:MAG: hypothetical protein M1816_003816 [Peltula sp. TS41687]|nr:MAG: hypothetical protein M1816_003816 [Peltula sp. TS41687]